MKRRLKKGRASFSPGQASNFFQSFHIYPIFWPINRFLVLNQLINVQKGDLNVLNLGYRGDFKAFIKRE